VLNRALAQLPQVLDTSPAGGLTISESMRVAHLEFWKTTDPLAVWLNRHTLLIPQGLVQKTDLYNAFNRDTPARSQITNQNSFGRALHRLRPGWRMSSAPSPGACSGATRAFLCSRAILRIRRTD
jgi:hypothetical protein